MLGIPVRCFALRLDQDKDSGDRCRDTGNHDMYSLEFFSKPSSKSSASDLKLPERIWPPRGGNSYFSRGKAIVA